jgi:alcohol dehydrogenase (cytochrome c)
LSSSQRDFFSTGTPPSLTASGMLYVPTGNPGPDFAPDYRPGANLYTCSIVRLDAKTGALRGYHQFTPHDFHDWDVAASPILLTSKAGTKMVVVGSMDGYLYRLNPDLTSVAYKIPVTTIENVDAPTGAAPSSWVAQNRWTFRRVNRS